jgi:hypothetical protein
MPWSRSGRRNSHGLDGFWLLGGSAVSSASASTDRLTAELEGLALRAIRSTYQELNHAHFRGKLLAPVLELTDGKARLGRWVRPGRTLELARSLLAEHGWGVLVEVLKHEMAHQYVDEVLGKWEETAHGPAFRELCSAHGIDSRAAGVPQTPLSPQDQGRALERIAKLLALAQSPNVHEAHSAALAAQRLMLKYNLEALEHRTELTYAFRHLGRATGRIPESQRILAAILGDHFFVQVIWVPVWRPLEGRRGSILEACGTRENLELAEYVHAFLSHTAERLWAEYKRQGGRRGDRGRRTYLAGVMAGFREKLEAQKRQHHKQGLVWVGDGDLGQYFRRRHPRVRWTRHAGERRSEVFAHGREAGRRIVLHRGINRGPTAGERLLPPPSRVK